MIAEVKTANQIAVTEWRPCRKGKNLQGFATLTTALSLVIHDCTVHPRTNGARWIGMPTWSYTKVDGETAYIRIIDFAHKPMYAFSVRPWPPRWIATWSNPMPDNQAPPPTPLPVLPPCFAALPPETTERAQWFSWRAVWNPKREKFDKVPFIPHTENHASSTKKYAWRAFNVAKAAYETGKYDGVGFAIENSGLVFVDLDDVYDLKTGKVNEWAAMLIRKIESYTEFSPSSTGFHILARGQLPAGGPHELQFADGSALEAYDRGRYMTMTGAVVKLWPDLDLSMIRSYDFATLWQDHADIPLARPKNEPEPATDQLFIQISE
jgi:hypothetical protein